jgi:hypothetical protein
MIGSKGGCLTHGDGDHFVQVELQLIISKYVRHHPHTKSVYPIRPYHTWISTLFALEGGDLDLDQICNDFGIDCLGRSFLYVLHEVAEIDLVMRTKAHVAQKTVSSSDIDHSAFSPEDMTGCGWL